MTERVLEDFVNERVLEECVTERVLEDCVAERVLVDLTNINFVHLSGKRERLN